MSNLKGELKEILEEKKRFTGKNEQEVLTRIRLDHTNRIKLPSWKVPLIISSFVVVALLFIFSLQQNEQVTSSLLTEILEETVAPGTYVIAEEKINVLEKNDAFLIYYLKDNPALVFYNYYRLEKEGLKKTQSTVLNLNGDFTWESQGNLFTGLYYDTAVKNVYVGDTEATIVKYEQNYFWYAFADSEVNPVVYQYEDDSYVRISKDTSFNVHVNSFVPAVPIDELTNTETIEYKLDNMDRRNHHFTKYPVVFKKDVSEWERGEAVKYMNSNGTEIISRIVGLPGEKFAIQNGTVVINGVALEQDLGYVKVHGETAFESYARKYKDAAVNLEETKAMFLMNVDEVVLGKDQFMVVPDNWMRGSIEMVSKEQLQGKILGYNPLEMDDEWSAKEIALYEKFKENYDQTVLKNSEPVTIARLYWYAVFLQDPTTQYHLYTTRPESVMWTLEEHLSMVKTEPPMDPEQYINYAKKVDEGTFIKHEDGSGHFEYGEGEEMWGFQLILNEDGIWQVAFMPLQ